MLGLLETLSLWRSVVVNQHWARLVLGWVTI